MNHNTISIWKPGSETNSCSFLYRKEHEEDFKKHIKARKTLPKNIFTISPNAYHIEDLCLEYAAELKKCKHTTKSKTTHQIAEINKNIKSGELSLTEDLLARLTQEWSIREGTLSTFFNINRKIVSLILKPMYWEPPFLLDQNFTNHKQWWRLEPSRRALITEIQKEINTKLPGTGDAFKNYTEWLNIHATKLRKMRAKTKIERHIALNEASAYFMMISESHLKLNRHSLAALFLHRAADLLLMRACDEYNLINFTSSKPEFHTPPKNCKSKDIHFRSSNLALKQNGLSHDPARDKTFERLNDLRNHLMYTHYFSAPDKNLIEEIHKKTKSYLISIGGKEWENSKNDYQPFPELSIKILFESHPVLTSAITEINTNEILT